MLANTMKLDVLLASGTEVGVPDAYTIANPEGNVNTEKSNELLPKDATAAVMCGMQGNKDLPSLTSKETLNTIDPLASSLGKVSVTGISPTDLANNIPLTPTTPSFMDRVGNAIGSGLRTLNSLPLGQISQFTGMMSSSMGVKNPFQAFATFGGVQNRIMPNMLPQANGLNNSIGMFSNMMRGMNTGSFDRGAAIGLLSGIMSQSGKLNVSGAIPAAAVGVPRPIVDASVRNASPSIIGAGALGAFSDLASVASPGVIRSSYPAATQDFARNYTPQVGTSYMNFPGEYSRMTSTFDNVNPGWGTRQSTNPYTGQTTNMFDLSTFASGNTDFRRVIQFGGVTNMVNSISNNAPINDRDLMAAVSGFLPGPMANELSGIMGRIPDGFAFDPIYRSRDIDSLAAGGPGGVVPEDGSVGYGTITPEMREELNRLSPSNSSSARNNAAMMMGEGVMNYGSVSDTMVERPSGNSAQPASNPSNISQTQQVLYGDEPEFEGADEEAAEAAKKPFITEVTVY